MSKNKPVYRSSDDFGFWAYDVALKIFLKHLIDIAEPHVGSFDNAWLGDALSDWRLTATINDYGLKIDDKWSPEELRAFINLASQACEALESRESFSEAEIRAWPPLLDELCIGGTRGAEIVYTAPIVELGRAIIALAEGSLPAPPAGKCWYYGHPGGREAL